MEFINEQKLLRHTVTLTGVLLFNRTMHVMLSLFAMNMHTGARFSKNYIKMDYAPPLPPTVQK